MNVPCSISCKDPITSLLIPGQGVFLFGATSSASFIFYNKDQSYGLQVIFTTKSVAVYELPSHILHMDPANKEGISTKQGASYWFSLDAQNQRLQAGLGEARIETCIYRVTLPKESKL